MALRIRYACPVLTQHMYPVSCYALVVLTWSVCCYQGDGYRLCIVLPFYSRKTRRRQPFWAYLPTVATGSILRFCYALSGTDAAYNGVGYAATICFCAERGYAATRYCGCSGTSGRRLCYLPTRLLRRVRYRPSGACCAMMPGTELVCGAIGLCVSGIDVAYAATRDTDSFENIV
eukprot:2003990-Rhodomonas_salina.1